MKKVSLMRRECKARDGEMRSCARQRILGTRCEMSKREKRIKWREKGRKVEDRNRI